MSCYAIGTLLTARSRSQTLVRDTARFSTCPPPFSFFLQFVSWFLVFSPGPFAVIFTFGSIVGLCSSMFLCGPKKQWANMTNKTRIGCAATFVFFIIMTLVCALGIKTVIGTIFCAFCQYLALSACRPPRQPNTSATHRNATQRNCGAAHAPLTHVSAPPRSLVRPVVHSVCAAGCVEDPERRNERTHRGIGGERVAGDWMGLDGDGWGVGWGGTACC